MDQTEAKSMIIRVLEDIHERIPLWVGTEPLAIIHYINGFNHACHIFGFKGGYDKVYEETVIARGWKWTSHGGLPSMHEKGLDDAAIARELVTLEIESWKKRFNAASE
jgi:hypothetical protein